jgi:DNA-binding response OmpR family regulator
MRALLVSSDLIIGAKVRAAAARQHAHVKIAAGMREAIEYAEAENTELVILDLSLAQLEPAEIVAQLRSLNHPPARILAFGPHVHTARLGAAQSAGCDEVLSRGQFDRNLDKILAG